MPIRIASGWRNDHFDNICSIHLANGRTSAHTHQVRLAPNPTCMSSNFLRPHLCPREPHQGGMQNQVDGSSYSFLPGQIHKSCRLPLQLQDRCCSYHILQSKKRQGQMRIGLLQLWIRIPLFHYLWRSSCLGRCRRRHLRSWMGQLVIKVIQMCSRRW